MSDISIVDVIWLLVGFILAFVIISYIDNKWMSHDDSGRGR